MIASLPADRWRHLSLVVAVGFRSSKRQLLSSRPTFFEEVTPQPAPPPPYPSHPASHYWLNAFVCRAPHRAFNPLTASLPDVWEEKREILAVAIDDGTPRETRALARTACRTPQGRRRLATCRTKCKAEARGGKRWCCYWGPKAGPISACFTAARTQSPSPIDTRARCPIARSQSGGDKQHVNIKTTASVVRQYNGSSCVADCLVPRAEQKS